MRFDPARLPQSERRRSTLKRVFFAPKRWGRCPGCRSRVIVDPVRARWACQNGRTCRRSGPILQLPKRYLAVDRRVIA